MPDDAAGRQGRCKQCGAAVNVPPKTAPARAPVKPSAPPSSPATKHKPPPRIRRLIADARQMQAAFRQFPLIRVRPVHGDPPEVYHVVYHVGGLMRGPNGRPVTRNLHHVEIQLTREYPRLAPKCKMLTPVFHPNIEPATICVGDHWTAGERLADLVVRIGEMIAYQAYNIKSPLDGEAAMWADLNAKHLPVDRRDLHPPDIG
ncbi:MAG: ubiquitin-conjugating enzyme E2 [Planctomycetaceae bacterium]